VVIPEKPWGCLTTPRFLWYDHDIPSKRVFKCIEFTFNNPTVSL
jgi:hypothetical protein